MLLRSKKTHGEEQNWCVILSPIKNEFDKKKVAHKISEIFSVSNEESMDLVSNTPIILLDNLTRPLAAKIKEFFNGIGADTVLTNDVLQKRKCYRTVWPETPDLSFLHQWQPAENHPGAQTLPAAEALEEIRSMEPPIPITAKSSALKFSDFTNQDRQSSDPQELERLRKECALLREQAEHAREELIQVREQARLGRLAETQSILGEKDKESKELRMLLAHAEEKYQVLHAEYREARSLYEEKISLLMRELEQWKLKNQETVKVQQTVQTEKQSLLEAVSQKEALIARSREEHEKSVRGYEQKISQVMQELDSAKLRAKELNDKLLFLQRNKEQLETSVNEQADRISGLNEKNRQLTESQTLLKKQKEEEASAREVSEKRVKELEHSLREQTDKTSQWAEKHRQAFEAGEQIRKQKEDQSAGRETAEKRVKELELSVRDQSEKVNYWSEKHRQLSESSEQIRKQKDEEALAREAAEKRGKELSLKQQELFQEIESLNAEIKRWEMKSGEVEKHFQELQEAYQNQDQILQANLRQLEHREKELESARKQLREINFQVEQRESTQRRTRIAQEISEKESQLKKLVGDQEKMEAEIREREEMIRKVLQDQEKIEKEIMDGKQAQRHLAELAKREKAPRFKNGKETDEVPSEQGEA